MPLAPGAVAVRGLRADAEELAALVTTGSSPRAEISAAAAELGELVAAHVCAARTTADRCVVTDADVRATALLRELQTAADGVSDAATVLASAGLSDQDRQSSREVLAEQLAALAAALRPAELAALLDAVPVRVP